MAETEQNQKIKKPFYKRWWFIVIVVIVALGIIGSIFGEEKPAEQSNQPATNQEQVVETEAETTPPEPEEEVIICTAAEMSQAFDENELAANETYKNKKCQVTGTISSFGEIFGQNFVTLDSWQDFSPVEIQCFFENKDDINKLTSMSVGDSITCLGKCDGKSINVGVRKCTIVE